MAVITRAIAFSSYPFTSTQQQSRRTRSLPIRFSTTPQQRQKNAPPPLQFAVAAVTELLRLFSSPKKDRDVSVDELIKMPSSVDDVVAILRSDYQRAYFLTGNFTMSIYDEDCLFEDPTIKFRGRDLYSQNLDLLVPFLDSPSLELEKIEKGRDYETNFILAAWCLRTYLKLPWRPLITVSGTTTYDLDDDFRIVRHSESWNISALQAVGQILRSSYAKNK